MEKFHTDTTVVVGPPGTGKTTTLLDMVDDCLKKSIDPRKLGFFSFTRKAAHEARDRAAARFQLPLESFHYFRTLHSLAFNQTGCSVGDVFGWRHQRDLADLVGTEVSGMNMDDDLLTFGTKAGDRMFHYHNVARQRGMPYQKTWEEANDAAITLHEYLKFCEVYDNYRKQNHLVDYTDMIEEFVRSEACPEFEVLFIDEAQDLTPIQWRVVEKLARHSRAVVIAGDDDQAIYRWSGAEPEVFIGLQGTVRQLRQSYRVPSSVHAEAQRIIRGVRNRRAKDWLPRSDAGVVRWHGYLDEVQLDSGSWMILARNRYLLAKAEEFCHQMGYPYINKRGGAPVKSADWRAIRQWEQLRKGKAVTAEQATNVYQKMDAGRGYVRGYLTRLMAQAPRSQWTAEALRKSMGLRATEPWFEALTRIPEADVRYFRSALRRGEKLDEPRILLSTIHGVKGGEADNVVLLTDMAQRTYEESEKDPDSEARVWYVGATRAKHSLHIVMPKTKYAYEW